MDKTEIKTELIHKRMEIKAEIEKYRFLSEFTKVSYKHTIDGLLDLINDIDRVIEELERN